MSQNFKKYTNPNDDGRVKILKSQYDEVRQLYKAVKSERKVATHYNVSRRLISFILHPERYKAQLKKRSEAKAHLHSYHKEKHTLAVQAYRQKKRAMGLAYTVPRACSRSLAPNHPKL